MADGKTYGAPPEALPVVGGKKILSAIEAPSIPEVPFPAVSFPESPLRRKASPVGHRLAILKQEITRTMKTTMLSLIATMVKEILEMATPQLREQLIEFILEFREKARATDNPWDDLAANLLLVLLGGTDAPQNDA